ncbi:NADH-quinone oxidoreductase subunit NuoG [Desulfovibrio inopinatus]|uniref:NADH-quinone oxidoreductase subunit NuoG n=1 Tax=Desulfovibrio inopinatus TaxID=102109 RepID=UPI000404CFF4|nr:NADH-quinone oxidoreductase subunit NuoG [Desulfovibrio inopinatus]
MPKLIIDGREIEVEKGTLVIDAAEQLGIMIPRFCYHEALGNVGACRLCAVMFVDGPVKGLRMSCMVEAKDEMVVATNHPEAVAFRSAVIEWLMVNHPHDCPVCDEGGHCLLQDMTVAGGHGSRRYWGPKRTYADQHLGPLVQHEMNRCIHCYRCVRYYREYAGYEDYGVFGMAQRVYFGRFSPGRLESPFAGNLIDVCPTGTLTDKPSRYRARRWDLQRGAGICLHCSLGCSITTGVRYRDVVRIEARKNPETNDYFICDRGRYGFEYANLPKRPRQAQIDGQPASMDDAILAAAARLEQYKKTNALAIYTSARASLESQAMAVHLAHHAEFPAPSFFSGQYEREIVREIVAELDEEIVCSQKDIRDSDLIIVVLADALGEAPMLALALRQAARRGADVIVVDPRPVELPCSCTHIPASRAQSIGVLGAITRHTFAAPEKDSGFYEFWDQLPDAFPKELDATVCDVVAKKLSQARRPCVVSGTRLASAGFPGVFAGLVRLWRERGKDARLFTILPGPNAFGAALLDTTAGRSAEELLHAIESGDVTGLICAEADIFSCSINRERTRKILEKLETCIVLDHVPSDTSEMAHVFIPTQNVFEAGGGFVNQEGRLQYSTPVYAGGLPVRQDGAGSHPPRTFSSHIPGGDPRPLWQVFAQIENALVPQSPCITSGWDVIKNVFPIVPDTPPQSSDWGMRLVPAMKDGPRIGAVVCPPCIIGPATLDVLAVETVFGTEELSAYGRLVPGLAAGPEAFMHENEAAKRGFIQDDIIVMSLADGLVRAVLHVRNDMAENTLVLRRPEGLCTLVAGRIPDSGIEHQVWKERENENAGRVEYDPIETGEECPWKQR